MPKTTKKTRICARCKHTVIPSTEQICAECQRKRDDEMVAKTLRKIARIKTYGTTVQPTATCPEDVDWVEWFIVKWPSVCEPFRRLKGGRA